MLFSATTGGFYMPERHDAIPDDVVEITDAEHAALMEAQSRGLRIQAGTDGHPVAVAPLTPPVDLSSYLADRRWRAEVSGIAWNGWILPTDDRSQGKYMAELQAISLGVRADGSPWKFGHGFEPLSNDQVREMAIAARDHVLACFAKEAELAAGIADGTITTTDQIDSAFAALEPQGA